jgi:hypothetical protein
MSERGEYRSIHTVLIDGPDYQQLSPAARLVFLTLKLNLGPTGIDVVRALVPTLQEQTGYARDQIVAALSELGSGGWTAIEHNVVWVVRGLEFEPSLSPTNPKHRAGILRHVKGLPRVSLVHAFIEHYAKWFDAPSELSGVYPKPTDSLSIGYRVPTEARKTEDGRRKTETEDGKPSRAGRAGASGSGGKYPHFPSRHSDLLHAAWLRLVGGIDYARLRKAFSSLYPSAGPLYQPEELEQAIGAWVDEAKDEGGFAARNLKPEVFVADVVRWIDWIRSPNEIDGVPTAKGMKLLGAA